MIEQSNFGMYNLEINIWIKILDTKYKKLFVLNLIDLFFIVIFCIVYFFGYYLPTKEEATKI